MPRAGFTAYGVMRNFYGMGSGSACVGIAG